LDLAIQHNLTDIVDRIQSYWRRLAALRMGE
jgi:hypothetical protein